MNAAEVRIAICAAEFNRPVVDVMVASATDEAERAGAKVVHVARVPGSYELPLLAKALILRGDVHALVVLGYIERGETQHGEVMGHVVHRALMELSLAHGKPMGLGIIGPGATPEQAETRKDAYARSATKAALAALAAIEGAKRG